MELVEKVFKLKQNKTDVKTEVISGLTIFLTVSFILAMHPAILEEAGMDKSAVFTATLIASIASTLIMSLYANYPFALTAGMSLNAFFTYKVVESMGKSWEFALTAVFIEGIIFILLTVVNIRDAIANSIPNNLKHSVAAGIGLLLAFKGLRLSGLINSNQSTLINLININSPSALVLVSGLFMTVLFVVKKWKGALAIGILTSTLVGIPLGLTEIPTKLFSIPPSIAPTAFSFSKIGIDQVLSFDMFFVVITFLFFDLFDSIAILIGNVNRAGLLDEENKMKNLKPALFADAFGTTLGAVLGTSTISIFPENASGIASGGRTGLTSFTVAVMFIVSLFCFPIFSAIPAAAISSSLIISGLYMCSAVLKVDFEDFTEALPSFITLVIMPLTGSIGDGIMFGIITYTLVKLFSGREKDLSPLVYILAILFVFRIILK